MKQRCSPRLMKGLVVALALCAASLGTLEVWLGGSPQWDGGGDDGGGGALRRITLTSTSRDPRLALAVALLDAQGDVVCSGVSLSARWVLTAAHCLLAPPTRAQAAHGPHSVPLAELFPHARFSYRVERAWAVRSVRALANDVGLVRARYALVPPAPGVKPRRASPIEPPRRSYKLSHYTLRDLIGKNLVMVGLSQHLWSRVAWGVDAVAEISVAGYTGLMCGALGPWVTPARDEAARHEAARAGLGPRGAQWRGCVCARATRPLCRGESGAGLFLGNQLVAVASLGPLNCSQPSLSVFTIISPFIKSIQMTITKRNLLHKDKNPMYVDIDERTTSVHPYIQAIRSKKSRTVFDYNAFEKLDSYSTDAIEILNETYAHKRMVNRSTVVVAAAGVDTRGGGGGDVSAASQSDAASTADYDTFDIYVPGSVKLIKRSKLFK